MYSLRSTSIAGSKLEKLYGTQILTAIRQILLLLYQQNKPMLSQLYLRNYALFTETQIEFYPGLNILTGETGAGKSLLVGALGLIMGKRADNSVIFAEDERCVVEAKFSHLSPVILARLRSFEDFDIEENEVIIRREISASGKSRAFINDTPVGLNVLRDAANLLVDLHGQHENQLLLSPENQLNLLDEFAGAQPMADQFQEKLKACESLSKQIRTLEVREAEGRRQLDYLVFQLNELDSADLREGEEEELDSELKLLQNAESIREALGASTELLYHQETSLYSQLSSLLEQLRKVANVNVRIFNEVERLNDIRSSFKEIAFSFQDMLEAAESDPKRLSFIEERLAAYHKLKLKYNVRSGQELIALTAELRGKLDEFSSMEEKIRAFKREQVAAFSALATLGLELEALRLSAKPQLEDKISALLTQIGFQKARFEVAVERQYENESELEIEGRKVKAYPRGINRVFFLIQTNPGMPAGMLSQIASGGEISRVMLAIKAVLAEKSEFPVLIFDEIDTGISGETAARVGILMQQLAQRFQILSITHLPQIAAKGSQHFQLTKEISNDTTRSQVTRLSHEDRVLVLARMLSGDNPSDSAMKNAAELISGK